MLEQLDLLVHATHEAGIKLGGIGAVLDGLLSQPAYHAAVKRTVLVGPFNSSDGLEMGRLTGPGSKFQSLYFTYGGEAHIADSLRDAFKQVERDYNTPLLYGKRRFGEYAHEVLLVDPHQVRAETVNEYKYYLNSKFGVNSQRYEYDAEYNWFIAAAAPSMAALGALVDWQPGRAAILAHEWLGLPLAFAALHRQPGAYRTVFYAHEVAAIRPLVENDRGHDTRFYNALRQARAQQLYLGDVFGDPSWNFKHALVSAASRFDSFLAVSDITLDELRFLSPEFARRPMALVYNGVPSPSVTLDARHASKERLRRYTHALFGYEPTWTFSHVARMVLSKAFWRDIRVMEQLDQKLAARGETAILFILSSQIPSGRSSSDVWRWENEYGWPVFHRTDNGDLVGLEIDYWQAAWQFNQRARASRIVLANQFGWNRERCGGRMPADMEYADIRRGVDLEFGQSIYEPFGIAQLEPLSAGALCCISTACGCTGFITKAGGMSLPNIVLADYITLPPEWRDRDVWGMLNLGQVERDQLESAEAWRASEKIIERLPRTAAAEQQLLNDGQALSQRMSWQSIVEDGLLPALRSIVA